MAELAKKLHFLKNGTEQTAKIYTTASEAGNNYIKVKVGGTTGYVPLDNISHGNATIGRVTKSSSTYAILSSYTQILSYHGTIESLYSGGSGIAATAVGNYALFGGGGTSTKLHNGVVDTQGTASSAVYAYDTSLTKSVPTSLSKARRFLKATAVGNYALFGGGISGTEDNISNSTVDAYNTSLTRTTATSLSEARGSLAATAVGNYALFGGGSFKNTVDAYDTSLTRHTPTALTSNITGLAATTVGNYALFGGGSKIFGKCNEINAYDTSLTKSVPTALSAARGGLAATTVGNYALFGGGDSSSTVDAYKIS